MRSSFFLGAFSLFLLTGYLKASLKLNPSFTPFGKVVSAQFQPTNGSRVVYTAYNGANSAVELLSGDYGIGPSSTINLSSPLIPGGNVTNFQISPNGNHVVFIADKETDNVNEIYSILIEGGVVVKLNNQFANGIEEFQISSDSKRVVYLANQLSTKKLYSAPIEGGPPTKLSEGFAQSSVLKFQISPDSAHVVYCANQNSLSTYELYHTTISNIGSAKLNSPFPILPDSDFDVHDFKISPDNKHVVYGVMKQKKQTNWWDPVVILNTDLYRVGIDGLGDVKLNNDELRLIDFKISPDSSQVIYVAAVTNNILRKELYRVSITNAGSIKLNAPLVENGSIGNPFDFIFDPNCFQISPDSAHVVYLADQDTNNVFELYRSSLASSQNIKLNHSLKAQNDVYEFKISSDAKRIVYIAQQTENFPSYDLFSVSLIAPDSLALTSFTLVDQFQISHDSSYVFYTGASALVRVPITGGNINAVGFQVDDFLFHPTGNPVLYINHIDTWNGSVYVSSFLPPIITSPLTAITSVGATNFSYTITTKNGPINSYSAFGLPNWAVLNDNQITGIPEKPGNFPIKISAINDVGFDTKVLNLIVPGTNLSTIPSFTRFSADFDGDGFSDLLAQKKKKVTLINLNKSNEFSAIKTFFLNPGERVRAANFIHSNNALIVQNKTAVKAFLVDSNFNAYSNFPIGFLNNSKTKIVASGDINGDKLTDIITQQGKTISAFISPNYFYSTVVNMKTRQKVVGIIANAGDPSNMVNSILLQKGKKLFFYNIPTNAPFLSEEILESTTGPVLDKAYQVVGATVGTNIAPSQLIIKRGKKVNIVNFGTTSFGSSLFKLPQKVGKLVGPR